MKKSGMALKPYLEAIVAHCNTLSNEELMDIIIGIAKEVPTSGRADFLERMDTYLSRHQTVIMPETSRVDEILNDIQALKESIEERIVSIEEGSYWDDPGDWSDESYYEEEPDYISEDQIEELESFFEDAEYLFMDDRIEDAREVYEALLSLFNDVSTQAYFPPMDKIDIREARAIYCRCVYETADPDKRLDEFIAAMEIDTFISRNENEYDENYPMMHDVIDAKLGEMEGLTSFMPAWKKVLTGKERKGRPAVLLLETVYWTEGIAGVSELARKWKNNQPQGYLYWLHILNNEKNQKEIITVSTEGLNAIARGKFRMRIAEFMIDAAGKLNDSKHLLFGKREKSFSSMNDRNLLDLMDEAIKQDKREKELHAVIGFFKTHNSINDDKKTLYIRTLLMLGEMKNAVEMVEKEHSVGWSYGNNAGVVFGAVLFVLSAYSEEASTIKTLLKGYADKESIYSGKISIDDGTGTSFYDEIIKGLKQNEDARCQASESLSWAEKIGGSRIEHIVSNKHRGAYERAAQVLGSLAEAYAAMGDKGKATNILHKYYAEKYGRFSAFRREVKTIVLCSNLLRDTAL